ncbi:metal-dependent transcriptional regulator [Methylacidiphilum caldifontis]|uniref:Transcriptional regulator MntR n=1 Tax=Methylacidiphilum caldifontis TaxID=2795386 RepID=A0A4Y8PCE9_9BACT|nr:metal-dependent transcriptional regulator [Methylacidiphilum caldifontis]QSR89011.1 metal-dependent transcriptional regulator [Methylacidiphilum caldifontis]TFE68607.1 DtxR family transcriptional regulator [Methylacidiphilum caldifontis]
MKKTKTYESIELSSSQEDYIKEIFHLAERGEPVTTLALAQKIGVKAASVTEMVKKLTKLGLVQRKPYYEISLTETGIRIAMEILRHHRLLETFLVEKLGYQWDEVHGEAERLEHVISEQFEQAIAKLLNHPLRDPHGDPIPSQELVMPFEEQEQELVTLDKGEKAEVKRIIAQDPQSLRFFNTLGLLPGTMVEVLEVSAEEITLQIWGKAPHQASIPLFIGKKIKVIPRQLPHRECSKEL